MTCSVPVLAHELLVDGERLHLRRAGAGDHERIYRDWLMSYRDRAKVSPDVFFREHRRVVARLLAHAWVTVRVGSTIHGWVCAEPGLVHYAYVPEGLRRHGLARAMIEAVAGRAGEHTHRRMPGLSGFALWSYNPYRIGTVP